MRNHRNQFSAISMVFPQILDDFPSISIEFLSFQSVSLNFSQFQSILISFNQFDSVKNAGIYWREFCRIFADPRNQSGVAPANQTKERGTTKSSWISPIFVWILVFFLGKTSTIHIELLFRNAPAKVHEPTFLWFGLVCRGLSWIKAQNFRGKFRSIFREKIRASKNIFRANFVPDLFSRRFREGISFPHFVERSIL